MSATTLDQQATTARRDYEISVALLKASDLYFAGLIPEAMHGAVTPVEISVHVATREAVEEFARQNGVVARSHHNADHGDTHTTADLNIDPNGAVRIHIVHIAKAAS